MFDGWCAGLLKKSWRPKPLWYKLQILPPHCGVIAARRLAVSRTTTSTIETSLRFSIASQPQSSWSRHGSCGTRRSGDACSKTSSGQVVKAS